MRSLDLIDSNEDDLAPPPVAVSWAHKALKAHRVHRESRG